MTLYLCRSYQPLSRRTSITGAVQLVPLCSRAQFQVLCTTIFLVATAWIYFWLWWVLHVHRGLHRRTWTFPDLLMSTVIGLQSLESMLPLYLLARAKVLDPRTPLPTLRVAMITTRAPAEAFDVLKDTLKGLLSQDLPYDYHVWLADEQPTEEVLSWCYENGVNVSSRYGRVPQALSRSLTP